MTRIFDIIFATTGLTVLAPLFFIIYVIIRIESRGNGIYVQERIGKEGKPFNLYKFRSMKTGADLLGLITIGGRDPRVTRVGYFLRKYKIDELPQLYNVLKGDMSIVGPRPEVEKYVRLYTPEQRRVLSVRPGITDYASIQYVDENELLGAAKEPDKLYVNQIMPKKIALNMQYIEHQTIEEYFKIILLTLLRILK